MTRTQEARGEASRSGPEYADPFALQHQLTVSRTAIGSASGIAQNQGYIQGRLPQMPPMPPRPQGSAADHSSHLWRFRVPGSLTPGTHTARVSVIRPQGTPASETIAFEVRETRPQPSFRFDKWNTREDGLRVEE